MPLSCGLSHRRTSTFQGLHVAVASCYSQGSSDASRIPLHKPSHYTPIMHHSPCWPDIQTPFLQTILHGVNSSLPRPTLLATTSTLSYIDPQWNFVLLHSLPMEEPLENTFINPFVHTLHHSTQMPYPCTRDFSHSPDTQQTSEVVHLHRTSPSPSISLSHYHT